jgi:hypothetical protein
VRPCPSQSLAGLCTMSGQHTKQRKYRAQALPCNDAGRVLSLLHHKTSLDLLLSKLVENVDSFEILAARQFSILKALKPISFAVVDIVSKIQISSNATRCGNFGFCASFVPSNLGSPLGRRAKRPGSCSTYQRFPIHEYCQPTCKF